MGQDVRRCGRPKPERSRRRASSKVNIPAAGSPRRPRRVQARWRRVRGGRSRRAPSPPRRGRPVQPPAGRPLGSDPQGRRPRLHRGVAQAAAPGPGSRPPVEASAPGAAHPAGRATARPRGAGEPIRSGTRPGRTRWGPVPRARRRADVGPTGLHGERRAGRQARPGGAPTGTAAGGPRGPSGRSRASVGSAAPVDPRQAQDHGRGGLVGVTSGGGQLHIEGSGAHPRSPEAHRARGIG